jgi:hypothetical protein
MFVLVDHIQGSLQVFFADSSNDAKMDYRINIPCLLKARGDLLSCEQRELKRRAVLREQLFNNLPEFVKLPKDIK